MFTNAHVFAKAQKMLFVDIGPPLVVLCFLFRRSVLFRRAYLKFCLFWRWRWRQFRLWVKRRFFGPPPPHGAAGWDDPEDGTWGHW